MSTTPRRHQRPWSVQLAVPRTRPPHRCGTPCDRTPSWCRQSAIHATSRAAARTLHPRARGSMKRSRLADCGRRPGPFFTRRMRKRASFGSAAGVRQPAASREARPSRRSHTGGEFQRASVGNFSERDQGHKPNQNYRTGWRLSPGYQRGHQLGH
jgi:hypothetical protein